MNSDAFAASGLAFRLHSRQRFGIVQLAIALLALSCRDPLPARVPDKHVASGQPVAGLAALPATVRAEESAFADVARVAPSSAGFYFDATGLLTIRLKDAAEENPARGAVHRLVASGRIPTGGRGRAAGQIRVLSADFSFAQLATWRDAAFDLVLGAIGGVNSLDLDEVRNRVAIGIEPSMFASVRADIVSRLLVAGVDTAALVFDSVGRHVEDVAIVPPAAITAQSSDPLFGGLEIALEWSAGDFHGCTLGFVAQRNGQTGLVSASHCTSGMYGPDNNTVHQLAGRHVATETVDPYGYTCGVLSECRGADAFFAPAGATSMAVGLLARTSYTNLGGLGGGNGSLLLDPANPYWMVTAEENNDLYVGGEVHKVGRTTGWTHGAIKATCVDHYPRANYLLRCAYEAWYVAGSGDSGAPVFQRLDWICSICVKLVGIHSGRAEPGNDQARFSKMARIKSDLGGTWAVQRGFALATPSISGSIDGSSHPALQWSASAGASRYVVYATRWEYLCDPIWGCEWTAQQTGQIAQTTTTSFTHSTQVVSAYTGSTQAEWEYWVIAESSSDASARQNSVFFRQ